MTTREVARCVILKKPQHGEILVMYKNEPMWGTASHGLEIIKYEEIT